MDIIVKRGDLFEDSTPDENGKTYYFHTGSWDCKLSNGGKNISKAFNIKFRNMRWKHKEERPEDFDGTPYLYVYNEDNNEVINMIIKKWYYQHKGHKVKGFNVHDNLEIALQMAIDYCYENNIKVVNCSLLETGLNGKIDPEKVDKMWRRMKRRNKHIDLTVYIVKRVKKSGKKKSE